jgi:hypothetical protein
VSEAVVDHPDPDRVRAVTERGTQLVQTEAEVDLALRLLVLNGGKYKPTVEQLEAEGIAISRDSLRNWRDTAFPRRYYEIRRDLGRDVGEEVAGRAFERALEADAATAEYIEEAVAKKGKVPAEHLAKNALALSQVVSNSVDKAQLLRDRPTEIKEVRTVEAMVDDLERLGVAKKDDAIDAQVVGEEDV